MDYFVFSGFGKFLMISPKSLSGGGGVGLSFQRGSFFPGSGFGVGEVGFSDSGIQPPRS